MPQQREPGGRSYIPRNIASGTVIEARTDLRPYKGTDSVSYEDKTVVTIQDKLLAIQADGRKCIFMIDEAHLLKSDVFAQLHILSQREESKGPLFSLMLCGQEELAEKLSSPTAKPLMSRIATGYYIPPLKKEDFIAYIDHHLLLAVAVNRYLTTWDLMHSGR